MNTDTHPETTFRRGPLAVLLTGIFLIVLDFFVVNVALPSVQQDLGADATALQWLVAGYALTFGGLLLVASRLADRWGRRRMFLLGTGLFVLSSAICGFAPDVGHTAHRPPRAGRLGGDGRAHRALSHR